MDINEIIRQGENSAVEFKNAAVTNESLAREMVAFANSQGGIILVGVEDDGVITGITPDKHQETWVSNIARDAVTPPIDVKVSTILREGLSVLAIEVPKGPHKPYQTGNKFYIRVGSTNRSPSQAELMRLFQQSGIFHFDTTGVENTSIADLNLYKIATYFQPYDVDFSAEEDKERLLRNVDILTESGTTTVAGMLIFGIQPQRHLHNASISFAHFAGNEISDQLLNQQVIAGTLDYQIDTALALIKNSITQGSVIQGAQTVPTRPVYEDKVFREILVNACVHRNYAISGSRVRIFLFSDRIEIRSPGRLPNTISIEKLSAGVSYAVNPVIVKFMENLRYIDKLGRGLPMVWQSAKKLGRSVLFEESGEEFVVTLEI